MTTFDDLFEAYITLIEAHIEEALKAYEQYKETELAVGLMKFLDTINELETVKWRVANQYGRTSSSMEQKNKAGKKGAGIVLPMRRKE